MKLPDCPDCRMPVDCVELKHRETVVYPGPRYGVFEPYEVADAIRIAATHKRCGVEFIWYVGPGASEPPPEIPEHATRSKLSLPSWQIRS